MISPENIPKTATTRVSMFLHRAQFYTFKPEHECMETRGLLVNMQRR